MTLKILVLEDNVADGELLLHQLTKGDFKFGSQTVTSKAMYQKALQDFKPDVILSDYSLPGYNGLEAFLESELQHPSPVFILVTGALPESTVIEIVKAGIDDYILKENLQRLPGAILNAYVKKTAQHHIDQLNDLRSQFVSIVAHQLRTPLGVVSWSVESVLDVKDNKMTPSQIKMLRSAYRANQRLVTRIGDMLSIINIEEGAMPVKKPKVEFEKLWQKIMLRRDKESRAKGVAFKYHELIKSMAGVKVDPDQFKSAVERLTDNAIAYTQSGGMIVTRVKLLKNTVRFEISDTGVGIPEIDKATVFTPFTRGSNASVIMPDASGLGLALAKYSVDQQGGTIGFESKENKGSTFWFEIPAQ